ncbi:hypothetical protein [Rhodoflexus sp.]
MAHIRLRINQKEYELEGSEEFILKMEPKLTEFLEKHLEDSPTAAENVAVLKRPADMQVAAPPITGAATGQVRNAVNDAYIKDFLDRYNNFNNLIAGKK